jgi:hypothetical protein
LGNWYPAIERRQAVLSIRCEIRIEMRRRERVNVYRERSSAPRERDEYHGGGEAQRCDHYFPFHRVIPLYQFNNNLNECPAIGGRGIQLTLKNPLLPLKIYYTLRVGQACSIFIDIVLARNILHLCKSVQTDGA